jgi:molecular chaperone GrpE
MSKVKIQKPKIDTAQLQEQIQVLDENWKRALADYQNLLKRVESEKKDFSKFLTINMIAKLLPTLDILEMAATHSADPGVQMAVKQFQQVLKEEGLEEIVPQSGDTYNHELHECIEVVSGEASEQVAEVITKGYKLNDYIIRPAKVKVWQKS